MLWGGRRGNGNFVAALTDGVPRTVVETGLWLSRKWERICWGTEGSNPSPSSSESDANLIPEAVGLGRAIKHGDRIGANTPGVCRVAAADILTRRPARKAAFSPRPGCRHPWRSPLGKTHIPDKSMLVPSMAWGVERANGGNWRQRARASRPDSASVAGRGMATAGHRARSLFHPRGDPSDLRGDAWRFRDAACLLLLSQLHRLRAGPGAVQRRLCRAGELSRPAERSGLHWHHHDHPRLHGGRCGRGNGTRPWYRVAAEHRPAE